MAEQSNERLFFQAYEEFSDVIFRHCYFRVSDREIALDLMQETFARTWKVLAAGTEIQYMRAFLYRVANRVIIDFFRKKKPLSLTALQEKGFLLRERTPDPNRPIEAKEIIAQLNKLEEKYRLPILLRYLDELGVREIAEILGERETTISVRIHRGLKQLRKLL